MTDRPAPDSAALRDALSPHRQETSLGDDPRAAPQIEVTQLWRGELLSVRHYEPRGRPVTVGDRPKRRRPVLSGLLIAALVLGAAGLMLRQATLLPPPEVSEEDAALIERWTAERAAQRVADEARGEDPTAPTAASATPGDEQDPLSLWVEAGRASLEEELADAQRAIDEGRAEPRILRLPPFQITAQPEWERFLADELLPVAARRLERGDLPEAWRRALELLPPEPASPEAPETARIAEQLAIGQRVRQAGDPTVWTVAPSIDPDRVALAAVGQRSSADARDALWLVPPTPFEVEAHAARALAVASLLYRDALARRASRDLCAAASRLLRFPGSERVDSASRAELSARAGWCALNRGAREEAREHLADATGPLDDALDPAAKTVLLGSRARLARIDAEAAATSGDPELRRAARAEAFAALAALRAHIEEDLRSPSDLRGVVSEVHALELDALAQRKEGLARAAGGLSLLILFLLPVALVADERRARRSGCDFFVDADALPSDPYPLIARGDGPQVTLPPGTEGELIHLDGARSPLPRDGVIALRPGLAVRTELGGATFVLQQVQRPRGVPGDGARLDWGYLGVLAALLMLSAAFTVVLASRQEALRSEVLDMNTGITSARLDQPAPPSPAVHVPVKQPDAGEGQRAAGPEGRRGLPQAPRRKSKGGRTAAQQQNAEAVRNSGIFLARDLLSGGIFGDDGLPGEVSDAVGGLEGPRLASQQGDGWGPRGEGTGGGCMSEGCAPESLSGVGTRPGASGRDGGGPADGLPGRREAKPMQGDQDAIVLGSIDKSVVDRVIKQHLGAIKFCYERELQANPKLSGKMTVKFVIGKSGAVSTSTSAFSTLGSESVESCVHQRFLRMKFPAPKGGGIVMVRYPLVFDAR